MSVLCQENKAKVWQHWIQHWQLAVTGVPSSIIDYNSSRKTLAHETTHFEANESWKPAFVPAAPAAQIWNQGPEIRSFGTNQKWHPMTTFKPCPKLAGLVPANQWSEDYFLGERACFQRRAATYIYSTAKGSVANSSACLQWEGPGCSTDILSGIQLQDLVHQSCEIPEQNQGIYGHIKERGWIITHF